MHDVDGPCVARAIPAQLRSIEVVALDHERLPLARRDMRRDRTRPIDGATEVDDVDHAAAAKSDGREQSQHRTSDDVCAGRYGDAAADEHGALASPSELIAVAPRGHLGPL